MPRLSKESVGMILAVVLGVPSLAAAVDPPTVIARCSYDQLTTPAAAEARLSWMRRCALKPLNPTMDAIKTVVSCDGIGPNCFEYKEPDAMVGNPNYRSYVGTFSLKKINNAYFNNYYDWDMMANPVQSKDLSGGYYQWAYPGHVRTTVFYPSYGKMATLTADPSTVLYPSKTDPLDCKLYTAAGVEFPGFYVQVLCASGCYTPEQLVRFEHGYEEIGTAAEKLTATVVTLDPRATLENLMFMNLPVESYTKSTQASDNPIYEIRTAGGGTLRITPNHPVVRGDGMMVEAQSLRAGDALVLEDGTPDPIVFISSDNYYGKVYNLKPKTTNRIANILVAQGFLMGSSAYQNEDVEYINRLVLRRSIPIKVIPR